MMRYDSSSGSSSSDDDEDARRNRKKQAFASSSEEDSEEETIDASQYISSSVSSSSSSSSSEEESSSSEEEEDSSSEEEQPVKARKSLRVKSRKVNGQAAASAAPAASRSVPAKANRPPPQKQQQRQQQQRQYQQHAKEDYTTDEDDDPIVTTVYSDDDSDYESTAIEVPSDDEEDGNNATDVNDINHNASNAFENFHDEDNAFREIPPEAFMSPKPKTPRRRQPRSVAMDPPPQSQASQPPPPAPPSVAESVRVKKKLQTGVDFFQDVPFCGRERELVQLQKAVQRISIDFMENSTEVVWITGMDGVGKTSLAMEMYDRAFDLLYCAYGSFEQNTNGAKPFSGLTECLNDLVQRMVEDGGMQVWQSRMEEALGGEGPFLATVIPKLSTIMNLGNGAPIVNQTGNGNMNGNGNHPKQQQHPPRLPVAFDANMPKRTERLHFAIRDFLCAIAEHFPILLVVDNLHHADMDSLRMLQSLATDKAVQNVLIIGCQDDNTSIMNITNSDHNITSLTQIPASLAKIQDAIVQQGTPTTIIDLTPLSQEETEQLLSIALIEEGDDDDYDQRIEELAEILFAKCEGYPLYILHMLRVLQDHKYLQHSSEHKIWIWETDGDKMENFMDDTADTVVDLLQDKIEDLPKKMRLALSTAACAGMTYFQVDTLYREIVAAFGGAGTKYHGSGMGGRNVNKDIPCPIQNPRELAYLLNIVASQGLVEYLSHGHYKFSHDLIRHAAFSLLPKGKKGKLIHYRIGTEVSSLSVEMKEPEEKARLKFLAVDNLNRCALGIVDEKQRMKLSKLNMEAAEVAITKSAFHTAVQYLKNGISNLDPKIRWKKPLYELTLRMHLLLARTQYCCGQCQLAEATIHILLKNAMCFKDKVGAYQCMIFVKVEQEKYQEALDLILFILFQLGQDIPMENVKKIISKEIDRVRAFCREKENKDLLNPPTMTDRKLMDCMAVLAQLAELSKYFQSDRQYRSLATLRMMKLTLRHGYCRQTSLAYSLFASMLARYNIHKEAYRIGRLAERLATNRPGCIYASQALAHYHWNVSHWGRSYIRNLAPLLKLYNDQVDVGDFVHTPFSIVAYINTHLASGCDLEQLEHNLSLFYGVFSDYQLQEDWQVTIPQRMTLNLMGKRGDPDVLFGNTQAEQDAVIKQWEESEQVRRLQTLYFARMFIACFFDDMVKAHQMQKKLTEKPDGVWIPYRPFFDCMILLSRMKKCTSKKEKAKLLEKVDKIIYKMTGWHNDGAVNCSVLVNFLDAELEVVTVSNKDRSALKMRKFWDEAIEEAKTEGFLHLDAWANERAGRYFVETEVSGWASTYLTRAHRAYQRWGCHSKASLLEVQFPQYLKTGDRFTRQLNASDWRAKYDTTRKSAIERELNDVPEDGEEKPKRTSIFQVPKSPFGRNSGEHGDPDKKKKKKKAAGSTRRIPKLFSPRKQQAEESTPMYESASDSDDEDEPPSSPKTPKRSKFRPWGKSNASPKLLQDEEDEEGSNKPAEKGRRSKIRLSGMKKRGSKKPEKNPPESANYDGLSD